MNKKIGVGILSIFVLLMFMINFVSAGLADDIKDVGKAVIDNLLEPFAKALLGTSVTEGELFFAKVLFFLIVLALIWISLGRVELFDENTWVLALVSFSASILAVRFLATETLIETIILPYSVIGIAISAGLPFIIYFLVVNKGFADQPSIVRRVAWIFFAVIFIGLWYSRRTDLGNFDRIYLFTALAAFAMAWMDGTIKGFFAKVEADRLKNLNRTKLIADLKKEINDTERMLRDEIIDKTTAKALIKNYQKKIKFFSK